MARKPQQVAEGIWLHNINGVVWELRDADGQTIDKLLGTQDQTGSQRWFCKAGEFRSCRKAIAATLAV